jgi:L-asparaginase
MPTPQPSAPLVAMFSLGGTIAMTNPGDGMVAALTGEQLFASVPGLAETDVKVHDFLGAPGSSLTIEGIVDRREQIVTAFGAHG